MPIYIYNSLTRKKEEFIPLNPPKVNIYTCGVTVYDESHIGHARSLYIFDVIRRYLRYSGFEVKFARNITDIDDKIINRARELNVEWRDLVKKYIAGYYEDLEALNIEKGDFEPLATENIPEMIKFIRGLIEKGYGYITDTGVYFSVRKFKEYGRLSGQGIEQMLKGVRKEVDETKQDSLDFALWKLSKEDEPFWESPWGRGRPGWHIECSVMSQKFLKTNTLDIHAGGRDLIFPHHENEIAQAEALTREPFAKYWMHHGLLTINGQKMAKSSGNFVTIKDFAARHKKADILKLFFLSVHYSHPIDYNELKIEEARKSLERFEILLKKILRVIKEPLELGIEFPLEDIDFIQERKHDFFQALDDDFNTPEALSCLFNLVSDANKFIDSSRNDASYINILYNINSAIYELGNKIFGLFSPPQCPQSSRAFEEVLTSEEEGLVRERENARLSKDYKLADKIRKELEERGIVLEDGKEGTTWRRKL